MSNLTAPAKLAFAGVTPVLRVCDVAASRDYYVQCLGFQVNFEAPDFVSVSRGKCCLFLCEGDQGNPGSWVWIDGKDVDAVYEELKTSGAKIRRLARQQNLVPRKSRKDGKWYFSSDTNKYIPTSGMDDVEALSYLGRWNDL